MISLTIPWKDLASSNTRNSRRGGKAHGWEYKAARAAIHLHALNQVRGERPAITGECTVEMYFYPPDRRRRDVMNLTKCLMDAMQGVVYADDYQVVECFVSREKPDKKNPRVDVKALARP